MDAAIGDEIRWRYELLAEIGGEAANRAIDPALLRDWRIYGDLAQALIDIARPLYADEDLGLDLDNRKTH